MGDTEGRLLLRSPVTEPVGHIAPACAAASSLGWTLLLPGTFFLPGVGNSCCASCRVMWEARQVERTRASAFESHHTQTDRCSHRQTDVPSQVLITHSRIHP